MLFSQYSNPSPNEVLIIHYWEQLNIVENLQNTEILQYTQTDAGNLLTQLVQMAASGTQNASCPKMYVT